MRLSAPQWLFIVSLLLATTVDFCMDGSIEWAIMLPGWSILAITLATDVALKCLFWLLKVNEEVGKQIHLAIWWFSTALLYFVLGFPYLLILLFYPIVAFLLCSLYYLCSAIYLSVRLVSLRRRKHTDSG